MPFFSVIIPVYNCSQYINNALTSVINQTFKDWEIIIIDDGSKDDSLHIAKEWERENSQIVVLSHKNNVNRGVSASRNLGIKYAKGEWIALLDADDVWLNNKLQTEYEVLIKNPDLVLLASSARIIHTDKELGFQQTYGSQRINGKIINPYQKLIRGFIVPTSGVTFKRESFLEIGGFNEEFRFAEDTLLFHQLTERGNLYFIPEELSEFRFHSASSAHNTQIEKKISARYNVYSNLLKRCTKFNKKITSFTLVDVGYKKILRNFFIFPHNKPKHVFLVLKEILLNREILIQHKIYAVLLTVFEIFLLPLKAVKIFKK